MRTVLAILGIFVCLTATGWGTPVADPCAEGTLATYAGMGSAGCSIGNLVVSGFQFSAVTEGIVAPAATDIGVIPVPDGLRFQIDQWVRPVFTGVPPRYFDSPTMTLHVGYTVDGPVIVGARLDPLIYSDVGSTALVLTTLSNGCELYTDASSGFGRAAACDFAEATHLGVANEVALRNWNVPDAGAVAEWVDNSFMTPEPAPFLLVSAGFAALAMVRRRL